MNLENLFDDVCEENFDTLIQTEKHLNKGALILWKIHINKK